MLKILKNLKQSWLSVLTIVALLCVQAAVDLELPNYTSKIVNTGIQAGGIEYAVPETISSKDMEAILLFSNDDDKILENYTTEESDGNYVIKDLKENEKEKYEQYLPSNIEESIYEHCKKAIDRACGISDNEWSFGEHGLPKIGIGDWNDGFSNIGPEGKGESVWLGYFLYEILKGFISITEYRNDLEKAEQYKKIAKQLQINLNTNAWDGRWFKRAFADNGDVYGSMENEECRIDSIAQSWSVISGAGYEEKQKQAMESLENHLVDAESGIIKLLDPPFEKGKLEPGYIKAYVPGVRENGGQYTHECCC